MEILKSSECKTQTEEVDAYNFY